MGKAVWTHLLGMAVGHCLLTMILLPYCLQLCYNDLSSSSSGTAFMQNVMDHNGNEAFPMWSNNGRVESASNDSKEAILLWGIVLPSKNNARQNHTDYVQMLQRTYLNHPQVCSFHLTSDGMGSSSSFSDTVPPQHNAHPRNTTHRHQQQKQQRTCRIHYVFLSLEEEIPSSYSTSHDDSSRYNVATNTLSLSSFRSKRWWSRWWSKKTSSSSIEFQWWTWALQQQQHSYYYDLIVNVKASILVHMDSFLTVVVDDLLAPHTTSTTRQRQPTLIYGGAPRDRWACGGPTQWKCREMVTTQYMSSDFLLVSSHLAAKAVLLPHNDVDTMVIHDDIDLSNWIHTISTAATTTTATASYTTTHQPVLHVPLGQTGMWEDVPMLGIDSSSTANAATFEDRWNYLQAHNFSKQLMTKRGHRQTNQSEIGSSSWDEFIRRWPWHLWPNWMTRFNLPAS